MMQPDDSDLARSIIQKADRLQSDKSVYLSHCQDVRDFLSPLSQSLIGKETPGSKSHSNVLDNTGEQAWEMLTAFLISICVPDALDWLGIRAMLAALNDDLEAAVWLEDCAARILADCRSPDRGFAGAAFAWMHEVCGYGTGTMFAGYRVGFGLSFEAVPLKQLLLSTTGAGQPKGVYRDFEWQAHQAYSEWGDNCPEKVITAAKDPKRDSTCFRFIHAVEPNPGANPTSALSRHMPLRSVYVAADSREIIMQGGFREMPYNPTFWQKRADEDYGRGRGIVALPDSQSAQRSMKMIFKAVEKKIDPTLMVPDDGIIGPIRTRPSSLITYRADGFRGDDPIRVLDTGAQPQIGERFQEGINGRLDTAFYKPLIQMVRKDRMTATEVMQVTQEGQNILGPYLGSVKGGIGMLVRRMFYAKLRGGEFAPVPRSLQGKRWEHGRDWEVEFLSPWLRQQKLAHAQGLAQFEEITTPLSTANPALRDNIDDDKAYRDTAETLGLPRSWLRSMDTVLAMRKARQEEVAKQQQHQQMMDTIDAGAKAAKAAPSLTQALSAPTEALNAIA